MAGKKVKWFTTGGTIDSLPYDEAEPPKNATNPPFSYLPMTLKAIRDDIRPDFEIDLEQMWARDSKFITEREMLELVRRIRQDKKHDVFVITHGTDTMPQNSRLLMKYLDGYLREKGKAVIMTGAILPLTNGARSDGLQNLRYIVQHYDNEKMFPPGVHVVMHERVFSPIGLRKDFDAMQFYISLHAHDLEKDRKQVGVAGSSPAMDR